MYISISGLLYRMIQTHIYIYNYYKMYVIINNVIIEYMELLNNIY